jgi:uncharacterized protein (TIGR02271 family)
VIDQTQAQQLIGQKLFSSDGDKVGKIGQIYVDDVQGRPEWVTVNTGFFGTNESFVPLADATLSGDDLTVPYSKDKIKNAPNIDEDSHLSEAEVRRLYEYYGVAYASDSRYDSSERGTTYADTSGTTGTAGYAGTPGTAGYSETGTARTTSGTGEYAEGTNEYGTRGRDTSGPTTDSAMTRSEEELNVGKERVQAGKARLRKWVETENVQVDVPVRKERAVLTTEPITDANRDAAYDGADITEEEHEVVLNEERPVVNTETVAKERVRLDTEVDESVETVGGDVRKERIDVDGDADVDTRRR